MKTLVATLSTSEPAPDSGAAPDGLRRLSFRGLGTHCAVLYDPPPALDVAGFEARVIRWMSAFEARYSRFLPGSLVSRINEEAGRNWVEVDEEMDQLLDLCDTLFRATRGVLDPTALPLIRLWDYKAPVPAIPSADRIAGALRLVGWDRVRRERGRIFLPEPGMALDFGGFGKEYAVDAVTHIAAGHGIENVLVDFGHDIRARGRPPGRAFWHVGLEDPRRPGMPAGMIGVCGLGVASSGDYLRCFTLHGRRYGHIIDPRTGWPVANGCTQATVVAPTCLHAGVLSTTAFVLGPARGIDFIQSFPGAEGRLTTDHARVQTRGFYHHEIAA